MATTVMIPPAAPTPMMAPSSAPPSSLLPRLHQTNPNPNPNPTSHHRLYVGNIPWDSTEEEIIEACSIFGRVVGLKLVRDKETGKHNGYGFIDFADEESALCAKRNQKGLLCHGRQLKVCDPIIHRDDKDNSNKNKKQQQKPQAQQNSCAAAAVVNPPLSDSFPVKRPHEEEADGEPQGSAHKRLHIDIQLPRPPHEANDGKWQSAAPVLNSSTFVAAIKKRSLEVSADDESQVSAIKRHRIIAPHHPPESNYVEPYSPSSPGFVWPQNKRPTIIHHIDFASALLCATDQGSAEVLVTDQGFIGDLLNLSSLLRSACI